jgi:hypothetical protein
MTDGRRQAETATHPPQSPHPTLTMATSSPASTPQNALLDQALTAIETCMAMSLTQNEGWVNEAYHRMECARDHLRKVRHE